MCGALRLTYLEGFCGHLSFDASGEDNGANAHARRGSLHMLELVIQSHVSFLSRDTFLPVTSGKHTGP